ncbi:MAG: hypothetical protein JWO03_2058 [Bacteroidetes bacterium]|nr:hypothetical protein [Bacteroidota bacterium]
MGAAKKVDQKELMTVAFKNDNNFYVQEQIKMKDQKLYMAMLMGNNYYNNVRIIFNTEEGENEIVSRIWARTDQFIVLRGGVFIPINSVIDIILD